MFPRSWHRLASIAPIVACAAVLLSIPVNFVDAAGTNIIESTYGGHHAGSRGHHDGHVLPWLVWLRDRSVEVVFGRPTSDSAPRKPEGPSRSYRKYANDVVIRFNVTNSEEEGALADAAEQLFLDIWAFTPDFVDVRVHTEDISSLFSLLPSSLEDTYATLIPNVAEAAWNTYPSQQAPSRGLFTPNQVHRDQDLTARNGIDNIFFHDYQPLSVVTSWLNFLESLFPRDVKVTSIGKSYEGKEIQALRISRGQPEVDGRPRKTVVVTGGLHAREWISTSTVTYLIWSFLTAVNADNRREQDTTIVKFLEKYDIIFIPILNPDGYEYTWESDRLWRKSRQQTSLRFCKGLDLDHAFSFGWDGVNHHSDPCSESYGGTQPFQAVEASVLATWAKDLATNGNVKFVGFLDLHSYSQQVLYPYSYSCSIEPPNLENLEEVAAEMAKAIRLSSGEYYTMLSACEGAVARTYSASNSLPRVESGGGSAIDWFYHEMKASFSYQIKLRDTGSYGFLLPSENIVPTGEEIFQAVRALADYLNGNNGIEKSKSLMTVDEEMDGLFEGPNVDEMSSADARLELRRGSDDNIKPPDEYENVIADLNESADAVVTAKTKEIANLQEKMDGSRLELRSVKFRA